MFRMLFTNKAVVFNVLVLLASLASGAGLVDANAISKADLSDLATGVLALVAVINGVAHHRAGQRVDVQRDGATDAAARSDAGGSGGSDAATAGPVDPGGA